MSTVVVRSFGILLLVSHLVAISDASAERMVFRRGFPARGFGQQVAPNLVLINGRLAEIDRFGRLRALFINSQTGQLVNATRADTLPQVAGLLAQVRDRLDPARRALVDRFLQANGFFNPGNFDGQTPGTGQIGGTGNGGRGTIANDPLNEGHGAGGGSPGANGISRPVAEIETTKPDGSVSASACRDLNAAVCANDSNRGQREFAIEDSKRNTIRSFLQNFRLPFNAFSASMQRVAGRFPQPDRIFAAFTQFLSGQIPSLQSIENAVKPSLLEAISKAGFDSSTTSAMTSQIGKLRFRAVPDLRDFRSLGSFVENCGPDGMQEGAFAVPGEDVVVICPGMLLRAKASGSGSNEDVIARVFHVLAHEMGHHIGADVNQKGEPSTPFRGSFGKLAACLDRFKPDGDRERIGESTADTFAVESMVRFLDKNGMRGGRALSFIQSSLNLLCRSERSEVHPSGNFRISFLLGNNPGIRALLGCQGPTSDNPGCSFNGKVAREGAGN